MHRGLRAHPEKAKLRRYTNSVGGLADAAFDHIACAEFLPNLADIWRLPLIGGGGVSGDYREGTPQ